MNDEGCAFCGSGLHTSAVCPSHDQNPDHDYSPTPNPMLHPKQFKKFMGMKDDE